MGARRARLALALVVAAAAGCGGETRATETTRAPAGGAQGAELAPPSRRTYFGEIAGLTRPGGRWELRLDPAWFLSGETASRAAAEDGVLEPGEPVPNDNYVVDESHRLLTFLVADDARVTVLTRHGDQYGPMEIDVGELAAIVDGTSTLELFEPLDSGVWIDVDVDTVLTVAQQYRP